MKPRLFFILLILFLPLFLSAQDFWKKVNFPSGSGTIFTVLPLGNNKCLAGSSTAIYVSTDDGDNWSKLSELEATTITAVLIKLKSGAIMAGTSRGIYLSTDQAASWTISNSGIDNPDVFSLLQSSGGRIFAGSGKGYLYASDDDGKNWTKVLTAGGTTYFESLAENSKGVVFAGTYNAYGSEGVYKSTDNGKTWTKSSTGLVGATAYALKIIGSDVIYACSSKGVHKSTDDGITWQQLVSGMPSAYSTNCLTISNNGNLYVGTVLNGAYYSSNQGETWNDLNSGLTNKLMQVMTLSNNGYLICGGTNSNLFKSNNRVTRVKELNGIIHDKYYVLQNYPNPFNPVTNIRYSLPKKSFVTISIYNILGQEIQLLQNGFQKDGVYTIEWIPNNLPGGIYFYKLTAGGYNETRRMTYLK